jgi:hypothetical protein
MRAAGLSWGTIYVKAGVLDPYPSPWEALDSRLMSAGLTYLRGRRRRFATLLLPALLLRALIPFGFMPLAGVGGLTIGFCPGEGALPAALAAANVKLLHTAQPGHLHHDHAFGGAPHGGSGEPGGSSHEAPCPFAASGKPAFAPAILTLETGASTAGPHEADATPTVFLPTVFRAQSPRGPPQIA